MRPPTASPARTALPAAHFDRNERYAHFGGQDTNNLHILTKIFHFALALDSWKRGRAEEWVGHAAGLQFFACYPRGLTRLFLSPTPAILPPFHPSILQDRPGIASRFSAGLGLDLIF